MGLRRPEYKKTEYHHGNRKVYHFPTRRLSSERYSMCLTEPLPIQRGRKSYMNALIHLSWDSKREFFYNAVSYRA